jgi:hypothetical protein
MNANMLVRFCLPLLLVTTGAFAQEKIMQAGTPYHGIRDYREVMPGVLYRGGANNGRGPLNRAQLNALCEEGIGHAVYLYSTQFPGPMTINCSKGSLDYVFHSWAGRGRTAVHQEIYEAIKDKSKPVFVHCWNGIHATGAVAATALMQFCGIPAKTAVTYWKVGISPKLQYPNVIQDINNFHSDPALRLTPEEQAQYCPKF